MNKNLFNLKIAAIGQFVSRSGTIFLHSLLDNHPEIITIPATIDINEFLINQKFSSADESYKIFEKNNPKFFDTSKFTIKDKHNSKLNILGNNKKKKY